MGIVCTKHNCKSENVEYCTFNFYHNCTCLECGNHFLIRYRPQEGCCDDSFFVDVIHTFPNDRNVIYEQCTHCGWTNKNKPKKIINAEIRGCYQKEYDDEWYERRNQEYNWFNNSAEPQTNFWVRYNVYLASNEWKNIRIKIFERDSNLCQICKIKPAEQVHHTTYKNVFKEKLEDLIAVCTECHEKHHKESKLPKKV